MRVAENGYAVLPADLAFNDSRGGEDTDPISPENLQQRAILELGDNARLDRIAIEPLVERTPEV